LDVLLLLLLLHALTIRCRARSDDVLLHGLTMCCCTA
jgi:hypothetical protein